MSFKRIICKYLDYDQDGFITIRDIKDDIFVCLFILLVIFGVIMFVGFFITELTSSETTTIDFLLVIKNGIIGVLALIIFILVSSRIFYLYYKIEDKVLYSCPLKNLSEQKT